MDLHKLISWKGVASILSLLFGLVFYVTWSSIYNSWSDISSYSVTVPFILLGLLGISLTLLE